MSALLLPGHLQLTCIGCGCSDGNACPGGCSWIRRDEDAGVGLCSAPGCEQWVEAFDAGERDPQFDFSGDDDGIDRSGPFEDEGTFW